jgi:hypothetical protein
VVVKGDVIVAGSDGLLDNLSELEIVEEVGFGGAVTDLVVVGIFGGGFWGFWEEEGLGNAVWAREDGPGRGAEGRVGHSSRCLRLTPLAPGRAAPLGPPLPQVAGGLRQGMRAPQLAQRIAKAAFDASVDPRRVTPYSRAATEAFDMVYSGGKKVGEGCLCLRVWACAVCALFAACVRSVRSMVCSGGKRAGEWRGRGRTCLRRVCVPCVCCCAPRRTEHAPRPPPPAQDDIAVVVALVS